MYEELQQPFQVRWARECGFGAKSLMRLQYAGVMVKAGRGLLLLNEAPERVATLAVGGPVALRMRSAAAWYGWQLLTPPEAVELAVPRYRSPTPWPGATISRVHLDTTDVVWRRQVPVTSPMRTAVDLARTAPLADAVAALDAACRLGGVRLGLLRRVLSGLDEPKTSRVAALIDPQRASVYESLFAVVLHVAGVRAPRCQLSIFFRGTFVGRVDFAWPDRRVVAEIDGFTHHSSWEAFQADRRRQNALVNAGWRVLRFTARDLLERPDAVVAEVRAALALPVPKINAAMIMV